MGKRTRKYAPRVHLSIDEKNGLAERIKPNRTNKHLKLLVAEWNTEHPERLIDLERLQKIRDEIPDISTGEEFWESVKPEVERRVGLATPTGEEYEIKSKTDRHGRVTKVLDEKKVPFATDDQLASLKFNFQLDKYNRPGSNGKYTESTSLLRDHFRAHFYEKGLALAPFSSFIDRVDQEIIKASVGDQWEPGSGVWKTMADAVVRPGFKAKVEKKLFSAFSDDGETEDRFNPDFRILNEVITEMRRASAVSKALSKVKSARSRILISRLEILSCVFVNADHEGVRGALPIRETLATYDHTDKFTKAQEVWYSE
jgi:hypothetical protein